MTQTDYVIEQFFGRHHGGNDLGGAKPNCVGYCRLHKCYITPNQIKTRECLKKHCHHLRRDPHPFWEYKAKSKENRKARKERLAAELAKYGK